MSAEPGSYHQRIEGCKKQILTTTLEAHHGNRTHAARALGLQRTYLIRLIKLFQIDVPSKNCTIRDC